MQKVLCQRWIETERGWGQRPDGFSLHITRENRDTYIADHTKFLTKTYGTEPPNEYDFASGEPYIVEVDDVLFKMIEETKQGLRRNGKAPEPHTEYIFKGD